MRTERRGAGLLAGIGGLAGNLGLLVFVFMTAVTYLAVTRMGTLGVVVVGAGLLAAISVLFLAAKYPITIVVLWFFAMSGLHTLGMVRMPGLPDFSFPRMLMTLVIVMMAVGAIRGRYRLNPPYLPDILLLLHTIYVLLNLRFIGNVDYFHSWYNSSLAPLLGYFFAKQYVRSESQVRDLLASMILVTVYFWITSFGEHFEIQSMVWPREIMDRTIGITWAHRSRGPFLQPALFGQLLGMYLMVHLFFLTRKIALGWKVLIAGNLSLGAVGLLYTYTRGGWVATAVGIMLLGALRPKFRKMVVAAALAGVIVASVGVLQVSDNEFLQERVSNTSTIENRLGFLASSYRMIQDHPLFGVGYFRYLEVSPLYNAGTRIPFYGFVKRRLGAGVPIHDIYIGRAAEEGMVSLLLYLGFIWVVMREYRRRWRENPSGDWFDRDTIALMAAMSVSFLVGGLVIDYRYFDLVNVIPCFLAGIIVGYPNYRPVASVVGVDPVDGNAGNRAAGGA